MHPWDIAAALVILQEAQGVARDPVGGGPLILESRRVLAANNAQIADLVTQALQHTPVPKKWLVIPPKTGQTQQ